MIKQPTPAQVKKTRKDLKLTQATCADLVHVKLRAWQRYEDDGVNGAQIPLGLWQLFCIKTETKPE